MKSDALKVPKQAKAMRDGVITPQNTISINLNTEKFDTLKMLRINQKDHKTWLHVLSGTFWSTSSDTHPVVEI